MGASKRKKQRRKRGRKQSKRSKAVPLKKSRGQGKEVVEAWEVLQKCKLLHGHGETE